MMASVSHLPHVLANVLVAQAARVLSERGRAAAGDRPELPRRHARGGRQLAIWARHLPRQRRRAGRGDRRRGRRLRGGARRCSPRATATAVGDWNDAAREDRRRLLEADLAGGRCTSCACGPEPPGVVAEIALALGRRRGHRRHGALSGARLARHGRAVDRGRRARPRGRPSGSVAALELPRGARHEPRFDPSRPAARRRCAPPADKSLSHRAALFGAMCDEPVQVTGYLEAADTRSTLDAVQALGALVEDGAAGRADRSAAPGLRAAPRRRSDRRRQRRHADAAAARLARRPARRRVDARRRRVDPAPAGRPRRRAAARRWARGSRRTDDRFAAVHRARHAAARDRVRAAGRLARRSSRAC